MVFSFSVPLKISMFFSEIAQDSCAPRGWGEHQFHYEFQLQIWPRTSEHSEKGRSGGWICSLICTNTHLLRMERLSRKHLVTHSDSCWPVHDTAAGIISHRSLELFSQSHTSSRCVQTQWHCACTISSSLVPRPPPLLLSWPCLSLSGTNLGPSPVRAVNPCLALLAQPARCPCSGAFSSQPLQ